MQVDERNIMFSRMRLVKGSIEYDQYYKLHPENEKSDNELRKNPGLCNSKSKLFDKINTPVVNATFNYLSDISKYAEKNVSSDKVELDKVEFTQKLKSLIKYFGADLVGITELKKEHLYSISGKVRNYGEKISQKHKYAIVFAVEMQKEFIKRAPLMEQSIAVVKGYFDVANIGMWLSYYLRELGYEAQNHMDGNYDVLVSLVARDAGLGEIGRHSLLLTPKFGPRVRLAVVTTNLELEVDSPKYFGFINLCNSCFRCAKKCLGKAITDKKLSKDERVKINQEKCYNIWSTLGSDCGVCLNSCPLSHNVPKELLEELKSSPKTAVPKILNLIPENNFRKEPVL